MTLAPELELVQKITTPQQQEIVMEYIKITAQRSERERTSEVKKISGVFTGAYAVHPLTKEKIPIWIGDYVLAENVLGIRMPYNLPSNKIDETALFSDHSPVVAHVAL